MTHRGKLSVSLTPRDVTLVPAVFSLWGGAGWLEGMFRRFVSLAHRGTRMCLPLVSDIFKCELSARRRAGISAKLTRWRAVAGQVVNTSAPGLRFSVGALKNDTENAAKERRSRTMRLTTPARVPWMRSLIAGGSVTMASKPTNMKNNCVVVLQRARSRRASSFNLSQTNLVPSPVRQRPTEDQSAQTIRNTLARPPPKSNKDAYDQLAPSPS